MSYKNLEIWRLANRLVIRIHKMALEKLPKFEMYEEAGKKLNLFIRSVESGHKSIK